MLITNKELRKIVDNSELSREEFSFKLNRSKGFVNIYLTRFSGALPIKASCLIAYHFPNATEAIIGKKRLNEILKVSKKLNFDPKGLRAKKILSTKRKNGKAKSSDGSLKEISKTIQIELCQRLPVLNHLLLREDLEQVIEDSVAKVVSNKRIAS